jgi:hypothetical protein
MSRVDDDIRKGNDAAPEFLPGLQLNALFFAEVVKR